MRSLEEKAMGNYEPSGDFVNKVMNCVRGHEIEASRGREHIRAFVFSKPVVATLSAAGILLGICNALRMALILISPSFCL